MTKRPKIPQPCRRLKDGSWRIAWYYRGRTYEAVIGKCDKRDAEIIRQQTALALADKMDWPQEIQDAPAIRCFLVDRDSLGCMVAPDNTKALLDTYKTNLSSGTNNKAWQSNSLSFCAGF